MMLRWISTAPDPTVTRRISNISLAGLMTWLPTSDVRKLGAERTGRVHQQFRSALAQFAAHDLDHRRHGWRGLAVRMQARRVPIVGGERQQIDFERGKPLKETGIPIRAG